MIERKNRRQARPAELMEERCFGSARRPPGDGLAQV